MKLEGKIALVTGASQGLGKAIALKAGRKRRRRGCDLCGAGRACPGNLQRDRGPGRRAVSYPCDVRDEKAVEETVAAVKRTWARWTSW